MVWCWIICGSITLILVGSLAEICSAYPTMGALLVLCVFFLGNVSLFCRYYWAFRLGGPEWGPFCSWTAGWCNLLGQIAGVASGGYAGAQIICNMISLNSGDCCFVASEAFVTALQVTMSPMLVSWVSTPWF